MCILSPCSSYRQTIPIYWYTWQVEVEPPGIKLQLSGIEVVKSYTRKTLECKKGAKVSIDFSFKRQMEYRNHRNPSRQPTAEQARGALYKFVAGSIKLSVGK